MSGKGGLEGVELLEEQLLLLVKVEEVLGEGGVLVLEGGVLVG